MKATKRRPSGQKRPRLVLLGSFVLALISGCKQKSKSTSQEAWSEPKPSLQPAVFAFDGTTFNRHTGSVIGQFLNGINIKPEHVFYYDGPSWEGSEVYPTISKALDDICNSLNKDQINAVFVVGLSRGAISAVTFVSRAEKRCGRPVPFYWLGLVDPVNTTIEDLPTTMPPIAETPCVLIRKKRNFEHVFTTKMIGLCNTAVITVPELGHAAISFDRDVSQALLASAKDLGRGALRVVGAYGATLYESRLGKDSEAQRCALLQGDAAGCLAAHCSYDLQGGLCRPESVKSK